MSIETSETLLSALQRFFEKNRGTDLLKGMREKAWDHFLELGLPEKKDEIGRASCRERV